jgi:hypothetical protein
VYQESVGTAKHVHFDQLHVSAVYLPAMSSWYSLQMRIGGGGGGGGEGGTGGE